MDITQRSIPLNQILAAIPLSELEAIEGDLMPIELQPGEMLTDVDRDTSRVIFPEQAVLSLCATLPDGESVDVLTVSSGGIAGAWVLGGVRRSPWRWATQVPGLALAMDREAFVAHVAQQPRLRESVTRYEVSAHFITAEMVVCNRFHELIQRLSRVLLTLSDAIASDQLPVTHDALSQMLGVHRPSVTLALESLRALHCVSLHRSLISVDRAQLELATCGCYRRMRAFTDAALLPSAKDHHD